MAIVHRPFGGPPSFRPLPPMWREGRVPLEFASLMRDPLWRGEGVTAGDGRPVLLVCGFLAGDPSLTTMARWLSRIGHRPVRAGLRWNVGCTGETVDRLERRAGERAAPAGAGGAPARARRGGARAPRRAADRRRRPEPRRLVRPGPRRAAARPRRHRGHA